MLFGANPVAITQVVIESVNMQRLWNAETMRPTYGDDLDPTARQINAHTRTAEISAEEKYRQSNEPEWFAVPSPPPSLVSAELALDAPLWLVQVEPGKCIDLLLPIMPLAFAAEEIQMSAQDPSFNHAPVSVLRVRLGPTVN